MFAVIKSLRGNAQGLCPTSTISRFPDAALFSLIALYGAMLCFAAFQLHVTRQISRNQKLSKRVGITLYTLAGSVLLCASQIVWMVLYLTSASDASGKLAVISFFLFLSRVAAQWVFSLVLFQWISVVVVSHKLTNNDPSLRVLRGAGICGLSLITAALIAIGVGYALATEAATLATLEQAGNSIQCALNLLITGTFLIFGTTLSKNITQAANTAGKAKVKNRNPVAMRILKITFALSSVFLAQTALILVGALDPTMFEQHFVILMTTYLTFDLLVLSVVMSICRAVVKSYQSHTSFSRMSAATTVMDREVTHMSSARRTNSNKRSHLHRHSYMSQSNRSLTDLETNERSRVDPALRTLSRAQSAKSLVSSNPAAQARGRASPAPKMRKAVAQNNKHLSVAHVSPSGSESGDLPPGRPVITPSGSVCRTTSMSTCPGDSRSTPEPNQLWERHHDIHTVNEINGALPLVFEHATDPNFRAFHNPQDLNTVQTFGQLPQRVQSERAQMVSMATRTNIGAAQFSGTMSRNFGFSGDSNEVSRSQQLSTLPPGGFRGSIACTHAHSIAPTEFTINSGSEVPQLPGQMGPTFQHDATYFYHQSENDLNQGTLSRATGNMPSVPFTNHNGISCAPQKFQNDASVKDCNEVDLADAPPDFAPQAAPLFQV